MAKWIYEKWDWAVDWDAFFSTGYTNIAELSATAQFHTIDDKGEVSEEVVGKRANVPVQGICIRERIGLADPPTTYNNSEQLASIFRKTDIDNRARRVDTNKQIVLTYAKKTTLLETITAEEGEFPDDGISGDYWYVKIKRAFPTLYFKDHQGVTHTIGRAFYKDLEGNVKELTDMKFKG